MTNAKHIPSSGLEHWVPGVRMLRDYQFSWLPKDLAAGITLGMVMIPVGLAFGVLAGVPLGGLYAGIVPLIAYALFGSSRQLIIGPDASMAALVAASLAPLAGGDAARLAVMACLLSVLIGSICILGSLLRLGFMADFLAKPVITGFMHGLAVVIAVGQLPKVLGIHGGGETTVVQFMTVCRNLRDPCHHLGHRRVLRCYHPVLSTWFPRIPGQIVALIGAILVVYFLRLDQLGVAVVGNIPRGLPRFQIPIVSLQDFQSLLSVAFAAALVAFSDTMATSRGFASAITIALRQSGDAGFGAGKYRGGLDPGLAGQLERLSHCGCRIRGSRTQVTSISRRGSGGLRDALSDGLLYSLPSAALGGILIAAAWNLCDFQEFRRMWQFRGLGLVGALLTMAGVVGIGVMEGIGIGVLFSLILVSERGLSR